MISSVFLRRSSKANRSVSLMAERLEARDCPAGKGPALTFTVVSMGDPSVVVTGRVTGTYAANSTVAFTGAVTTNVTTDAGGNFSFSMPANYLGTVTGVAWDNRGMQTNVLQRTVLSLPPAITSFSATMGTGDNEWIFSGQISNENLYNQTVTFSGLDSLQGLTTTTTATGSFTLDVTLAAGETGTVTATVADCWNLTGSAQVAV